MHPKYDNMYKNKIFMTYFELIMILYKYKLHVIKDQKRE